MFIVYVVALHCCSAESSAAMQVTEQATSSSHSDLQHVVEVHKYAQCGGFDEKTMEALFRDRPEVQNHSSAQTKQQ